MTLVNAVGFYLAGLSLAIVASLVRAALGLP